MSVETAVRPLHLLAAEAGSDRVTEMGRVAHEADRLVRAHVLAGTPGPGSTPAEHLREELRHVGDAVREALADDGALRLVDERAALAIPEMMRILLDEEGLGWDEAWRRVRETVTARLGVPDDAFGPSWTVALLEEVAPRVLELLYEINRRHLDAAWALHPDSVEHRRRVSLFREDHPRRLCLGTLALVGAGRSEVAPPWVGPSKLRLADLRELRDGDVVPRPSPVCWRRWLVEASPSMVAALSLALGEGWRSDPRRLADLEPLAFDAGFRGAFRAARRTARERLGTHLKDTLGIETDPDALVDVRLGSFRGRERLLLNILGVVREHLRLTVGGWTPPVPRTVVIAHDGSPAGPRVERLLGVARRVAEIINADEGVRSALRVAVVPETSEPVLRLLSAAADLSNEPGLAGSRAAGVRALGLAVGGAVTLGTRDGTVLELEDALGDENLFLFGLAALDARSWRDGRFYRPEDVYSIDPLVRLALDALVSSRYAPEPGAHGWVREWLLDPRDPWLVLADFGAYVHRQDEALAEFADPRAFTQKAVLTMSRARRFWAIPGEE